MGLPLAVQWLGLGTFIARARVCSLVGKLSPKKKKEKKKGPKTEGSGSQILFRIRRDLLWLPVACAATHPGSHSSGRPSPVALEPSTGLWGSRAPGEPVHPKGLFAGIQPRTQVGKWT